MTQQGSPPKYEVIRQTLADGIISGQYPPGDRLPSESELVKTFAASRPTVNRALRELQLAGLIERRAGSGSYVRADAAARGYTFGLLIPELGRTEIFEPICRGMAEAQHGSQHVLLWGSSFGDEANMEQQASQACRQLVAKKVSGVFFAPLELTPQKDAINRAIAEALDRAGIPVVLLDRDLVSYPERSRYDLVGIDNRRAGYAITQTSDSLRVPAPGIRRPSGLGAHGGRPRRWLPRSHRDCDSWTRKPAFAGSSRMIGRRSRTSWRGCVPMGSSAPTTSPRRTCSRL